jgi:polyvinyl alcohol dehydrogenase (cytochrome)
MKISPLWLAGLCAGVLLVTLLRPGAVVMRASTAPDPGEAVYKEFCAGCHDHPGPRISPRAALQQLSAARILHTLDFGVMMSVAYPLQRSQREAVARFLGKPGADVGPPAAAFCSNRQFSWPDNSAVSWTGWSPSAENTRFQPVQQAALNVEQVPI